MALSEQSTEKEPAVIMAAAKKRPEAQIIADSLTLEEPAEAPEQDEAEMAFEAAGDEIIAAVQAGDSRGVMDAIKAAIELCKSDSDEY